MKMEKCSNGHYYDAGIHSECPYCANRIPIPILALDSVQPVPKYEDYFDDEPTNILHNDDFYEKKHVVLRDKCDTDRIWKGYIYYHLNIGSDRRCQITIPDDYDDTVKPLHCRIIKKPDSSFFVIVLRISADNNGTKLNGHLIGVE